MDTPDPTPPRIPTDSAAICLGCSYPLSGLDPSSTCPECGKPVALSRPNPDRSEYPQALPAADPNAPLYPPAPIIDGQWPCARCGYGLHNQRLDAFCPSCGYPVAASVPDRAGYQTPRGVKCALCKYALDSLDHRGNCPECNFSIARSLRGDLLADSSPRHLTRLLIGARLLMWSALVPIIVAVIVFAALFIGVGGFAALGATAGWLLLAGFLSTYLLFFPGWFLLTTRDPNAFTPGIESMRLATRIGICVTAAFIGGLVTIGLLSNALFAGGPAPVLPDSADYLGVVLMIIIQIVSLLTIPIGIASMILSMIYLRRWSQRIPDRFIFKRARFMMWAWPGLFLLNLILVCGGFALVIGLLSVSGGAGMGGPFLIILPYALFLGSLLAFLILYAHLFTRTHRALATIRHAQRTPGAIDPRRQDPAQTI